jgi:ankyrin repeat protein
MIRSLYNAGAKIDYKDEEGSTLFLHSCEKGRDDIINFLINNIEKEGNGINIEENNKNKITLKELINENSKNGGGLHFAIIGQQDNIIELLLENNIDLNICNSQGDNALEYALKENQMNIFKTLFDYLVGNKEMSVEEKKKIFNHQNNDGNTILHELAFCKSSIITNMVLKLPKEFGVDPEIKNKEGYDYKQVSENIIELEKLKREQENKLKEERRRLKEELKQKKYEEERKIIEERKKYEEKLRKQEEFGQKLIENRGKIFTVVLFIFLALMYLVIKNASVKKERII